LVKIGSSVSSDTRFWTELTVDVRNLVRQGVTFILVASGAVTLGREWNACLDPEDEDSRRALASYGQMQLTERISSAFRSSGLGAAQCLVRYSDTEREDTRSQVRQVLELLCQWGIVPVVNEDDAHRVDRRHFEDNDHLAVWIAKLIKSDLTVFLTDTDGVFDQDPNSCWNAKHISFLEQWTANSVVFSDRHVLRRPGLGGMRSKVQAAMNLMEDGQLSVIANGLAHRPLTRLMHGARCTIASRTY
jgi:glutamate 5-kinase